MALVFDITHLGPYLPDEPNGKWIAANAVKVNAGYNLRFMHPDGWILKDYRVFQVDPNEDGSKPVLTATKTAAPEGSPARPAIGQKEVLAPNPVNNGNTVGSAVDTKRKIMKKFLKDGTILPAYINWPDPESDPITNPTPVRYHNPNQPGQSTFKRFSTSIPNAVVIRNRQNRGYIKGGIVPVFEVILRFEDTLNGNAQILIDPPIRNQR